MINSNTKTNSISAIEKEVISLHTTNRAIDDMVNHILLDFYPNEASTEAHFKDIPQATLFNSRLTDFLTPDGSELCINKNESRLESTIRITQSPHFNQDDTIGDLKKACEIFDGWLLQEPIFEEINLPSINQVVSLRLPRIFFIKTCGNILKHNDMSLNKVAQRLQKWFSKNDYVLSSQDSYMVLDDFLDWFHNNIFIYHGCIIAQMLNDIRHGIKAYLRPAALKSTYWVYDEYLERNTPRITIPPEMESDYSKHCYQSLMHDAARQRANVNLFKTPDYFKLRY
ncbi:MULTISPECIES: hypothetical protein [unclassified Maridesulfovibrio]|uniref:hypothetical protein n=1 Tax=unclassified Maridesulfovibrio TaxID=2794999 RepID=UPI003B42612E